MPFLTSNPFSYSISKAIERKRFKSDIETIDDIGPLHPVPSIARHRAHTIYQSHQPMIAPAPAYLFSSRGRSPSTASSRVYTPASGPLYAPASSPRSRTSLSRRYSRASTTRGRSRTSHSSRRSRAPSSRGRSKRDGSPPFATTPQPGPSHARTNSRSYSRVYIRPIRLGDHAQATPSVSGPRPRKTRTDSPSRSRSRGRLRSRSDNFQTYPRPASGSPARNRSSRTPSPIVISPPYPYPFMHSRRSRGRSESTPSRPNTPPLSRQRWDSVAQSSSNLNYVTGSADPHDSVDVNPPGLIINQDEKILITPSKVIDDHEHLSLGHAFFVGSSAHQSKESLPAPSLSIEELAYIRAASGRAQHTSLSNLGSEHFSHRLNCTSFVRFPTEKDSPKVQEYIWVFVTDILPRQVYLHCLLRLPYLYFSRVTRIFEQTDLTMEEIKDMALKASAEDTQTFYNNIKNMDYYQHHDGTILSPAYQRLKHYWEAFVDNLIREWKTLNIISALLLSGIMTMFQIQGAASDPVTRYIAFWSLICALLSLLYGCLYIIRFSGMRKPHRAAEWALEARKQQTVLWNVWVMLAMPVIWLTWSILLYIVCIMSFMWRVRARDADNPTFQVTTATEFVLRIFICFVLGIGITYGILIIHTLRCYGTKMDEAWKRRVDGYIVQSHGDKVPPQPMSSPIRIPTSRTPVLRTPIPRAHNSTPRSSSGSSILQHMPAFITKEIKHESDQKSGRHSSSRTFSRLPHVVTQQPPLTTYSMPPQNVSESSVTPSPDSAQLYMSFSRKDALPVLSTSDAKEGIEPPRGDVTSSIKQERRVITPPARVSSSDRPNSHFSPPYPLSHKSSTDSGGSMGLFLYRVDGLEDSQPKSDRDRHTEQIQKPEAPNVSSSEPSTPLYETSLLSLGHVNHPQRDICDSPQSSKAVVIHS